MRRRVTSLGLDELEMPSWAVTLVLSIENRLGRLAEGQAIQLEMIEAQNDRWDRDLSQVWDYAKANRERIVAIETKQALAAEKALAWHERMPVSLREMIALVIVASMGLAGLLDGAQVKSLLVQFVSFAWR